jgi:hypothetical protein
MTRFSVAGCEFFNNMKEKTRIVQSLQKKYGKVNINIENDMILYSSRITEAEMRSSL